MKKSKKNKREKQLKKKEKQLKKIRKIVKKEFFPETQGSMSFRNGLYRPLSENDKEILIDSIAKGVKLNKTLLERDKENTEAWQTEYHQVLFSQFKKLVDDYNESLLIKATELENKIEKYTNQIERLKEEKQSLKKKKYEKIPQ